MGVGQWAWVGLEPWTPGTEPPVLSTVSGPEQRGGSLSPGNPHPHSSNRYPPSGRKQLEGSEHSSHSLIWWGSLCMAVPGLCPAPSQPTEGLR